MKYDDLSLSNIPVVRMILFNSHVTVVKWRNVEDTASSLSALRDGSCNCYVMCGGVAAWNFLLVVEYGKTEYNRI